MATDNYPILGIDVSKKTLDICCLTSERQTLRKQVANDAKGLSQISAWLRSLGVERAMVCLEATSQYSAAPALYFYQLHWEVYLLNPAVSHASLGGTQRRTKTDVTDARDLAYFLEGHARRLHCWKPLAPLYQQLRWFVRELAMIVRSIAKVKVALEKMDYLDGEAQRVITKKLRDDLRHHTKQYERLQRQILKLIQSDTALSTRFTLLQTAPGVGPSTAMNYMSEIPDPSRFRTKREVAAYAGLTPRIRHSGSHRPTSQPISRTGSKRLRTALYMASLTAGRYNPALKQLDLRLKAKGKAPIQAKVAVARRLAEMLFSIEKHDRAFDKEYHTKKTNPAGAF